MSRSKTAPDRLTASELSKKAVQLKIAGHTYREIAVQLGRAPSRIHQMVSKAMADNLRETRELAREEIGRQLTITDELLKARLPMALAGDYDSTLIVFKALERRAKLVGADFTMRPPVDEATDGVQYVVMAPEQATDAEEWFELYGQLANQQPSPDPEKH